MKASPRFPPIVWKVMRRLNSLMLSSGGAKSVVNKRVLVLTTIGRKSGIRRETPLQYEEVESVLYVASARGTQADWYRNLMACPNVEVNVGKRSFTTQAEVITDPVEISDFLELKLERHPHFTKLMLRLEGLPRRHTRADLEQLVWRPVIVKLAQGKVV